MWKETEIISYIKEKLPNKRYEHVLGVKASAVKLAERYGEDMEKAAIAALIHDCAKKMKDEELIAIVEKAGYSPDWVEEISPQLLHGMAAAIIAKDQMDVEDTDILDAVTYHTTGRAEMSLLEKIIYIADYIEPSRDFPGVKELRKTAFEDLDKAMLMSLENTIKYIIEKKQLLHTNTVDARNSLLVKLGGNSSND